MRDPSLAWEQYDNRRWGTHIPSLGTCKSCGERICDGEEWDWHTVDGREAKHHDHCYQENYKTECVNCGVWLEKAYITLESRECPDCYRARIDEEAIFDHDGLGDGARER